MQRKQFREARVPSIFTEFDALLYEIGAGRQKDVEECNDSMPETALMHGSRSNNLYRDR